MPALLIATLLAAQAEPPADTTASEALSAAEVAATAEPGSAAQAHHDEEEREQLVVTGVRRAAGDVLGGVTVLSAGELAREVRPSLGETLARQPGVSATSFGPAASAPVLRGLSGDRVRVLTDGIGSLDLGSSGPDHAIAINPITADKIEVLRGPTALLFGSSAIGGVVNVIDSRIPRRVPDAPFSADALLSWGSAANERSVNAGIDVPLGEKFVLHADGNWSKSDDLETGGYILAKPLRREAEASLDPEVRALADLKGELPNSAGEAKEGAIGFAYIDGGFNAGLSVTRHLNVYEVPIRYSLEPGAESEAPTIDQEQTRVDGRVELPLGGIFTELRARGGYADYRHDELEESGEIGSSFFSKGGEGRVELVQDNRDGWGGTSGAQYLERTVRIRGEEKFLPDARQQQAGLFTLQTLVRGPWRFEAGARVERSRLEAEADAQLATAPDKARFTAVSGSVGGQYELAPGWRAGLALSHSERAPAIDELFANGPHIASQAFERGNPDLGKEKSNAVELSLQRTAGPVRLAANLFYTRFSNFIFQAPTGEVEDDLPVYEYAQGKARYYGFEVQASADLGQALGIDWHGEVQADAVRATIRGFGPAPLIPPLRMMAALAGERGQVDGRIEVEHAADHDRTAPGETDTPGYTMVNASLDWHPLAARPELTLSLAANNIFDVEARRSTSLLKDYAPLAGRDLRVTARFGF